MADAFKKLQLARKNGRPSGKYYIDHLLTDFVELHGDRRFGDDPAIVAGIGMLCGKTNYCCGAREGRRYP